MVVKLLLRVSVPLKPVLQAKAPSSIKVTVLGITKLPVNPVQSAKQYLPRVVRELLRVSEPVKPEQPSKA